MTGNGLSRRDFARLAFGGLAVIVGSSPAMAGSFSQEKDIDPLALLAHDIRRNTVPGATSYKVCRAGGRAYVGAEFVDEKNLGEKRILWTLVSGESSTVLYSYSQGGVPASRAVLRSPIVHADLPKFDPMTRYQHPQRTA